jgi:hypothetical protein
MLWDECEAAIRTTLEAAWALSPYATIPLVFENENKDDSDFYMVVNVEGTYAEKSIYGPMGYRYSFEAGIVFYHCFGPWGAGKAAVLSPVVALGQILELQTFNAVIKFEGANPPSPVEWSRPRGGLADDYTPADGLVPTAQPEGQYYRCSGSVPFVLNNGAR